MTKEEALYQLAQVYFTSHGPATVQDFTWWSGLTVTEATKGVKHISGELKSFSTDNKVDWFKKASEKKQNGLQLLPNYDEMLVGYKDRTALLNNNDPGTNYLFKNTILANGKVAGTWKRELNKNDVNISMEFNDDKNPINKTSLQKAIKQFKAFYK